MATYPIKMLKDEKGQPFVPCTSVRGIVDYTPETVDLTNYYNKEEIDNKLNSMFLVCNANEFSALSEAEIKKYYIIVVEPMAELTEQSTASLLNVLNDGTETVEIDITEKINDIYTILEK